MYENAPEYCSAVAARWIVITSINDPTTAVLNFASLAGWTSVIVADEKTPQDWLQHLHSVWKRKSPPSLVFLSVEQQKKLGFHTLKVVPFKSYARKNIGYLYAIACGAKIIYETDDDNDLTKGTQLDYLTETVRPEQISVGDVHSHTVNPYALFGRPDIWPRGFPLDAITNFTHEFRKVQHTNDELWQARPLVQQGLADLDPDVDAIWRLTQPAQIGRVRFGAQPKSVAIKAGFFTPYNSQNTIHLSEAFWGLLIPYSTSIRVCDIWRSYWVQRLLWDVNGQLAFRPPNVEQIRNAHDYLIDFKDELQLYEQAGDLVHFLYHWESPQTDLFSRMLHLAEDMAKNNFWKEEEVQLISAWVADLKDLGYQPPKVQDMFHVQDNQDADHRGQLIMKDYAVCITGQADRSAAAVPATLELLKTAWNLENSHGIQADTFSYISTYDSCSHDVQWVGNQSFNYSVLYNDKILQLPRPTDESSFRLRPGYTTNGWLQQTYGLQRCLELIAEFSSQHHIAYKTVVRLRTDHMLMGDVSTLASSFAVSDNSIQIPAGYDFGGFNDRIAWGSMDMMQTYMSRFNKLNELSEKEYAKTDFHAESFLSNTLAQAGIPISRIDVAYDELPKEGC